MEPIKLHDDDAFAFFVENLHRNSNAFAERVVGHFETPLIAIRVPTTNDQNSLEGAPVGVVREGDMTALDG